MASIKKRGHVYLGAFAGLRTAEACGLRVADVDFMCGIITPAVPYPAEPLKTKTSKTPIPIAQSLAVQLSAHVAEWRAEWMLTNDDGVQLGPWALERAFRDARDDVEDLPEGFRYHAGPPALFRVSPDLVGCQRQGGTGSAPARLGDHDAQHVRPPLAGPRRSDQGRRGSSPGRSCGQSAD